MEILEKILNFEWDKLAAFCGACIGIITLFSLIGSRWGPFKRWIWMGVQDVLGITDVKLTIAKYVEDRAIFDRVIDSATQKTIDAQQATQVQIQEIAAKLEEVVSVQSQMNLQIGVLTKNSHSHTERRR